MGNPILAIAHLEIGVDDLPEATKNYAGLLDTPARWQGTSGDREVTILQTSNVAVHLIKDQKDPGLRAICFAVDDLARMQRRLQRVGMRARIHNSGASGDADTQTRDTLIVSPQETRGIALSFVERSGAPVPDPAPAGTGLDHIVIKSANAEGTAFLLSAQLGLDMRMDISRPQWKARLMFFRCGDHIVEVFAALDNQDLKASTTHDQFYGLSWRVRDIDGASQRLAHAGFNVSEVREGRRPDSRVLTVRDKTAGVATLLIEPPGDKKKASTTAGPH